MPAFRGRRAPFPAPWAAALVAGLAAPAMGQTNNAYPMLMALRPAAAVVGGVSDHELSARYNLAGAGAVIVSGRGVRAEVVPPATEKPEDRARNDVAASKTGLRIVCDPDAVPGIRDIRVITPHGPSTVGQLVVVREPVTVENPDNDSPEKAQPVSLPASLCGAIEKGEDVDYWRLRVEAAATITFHMTSQRLQNRLHDMQSRVDPLLTLRDPRGATVAAADNTLAGDPLLRVDLAAGEYLLEVRDVRFQGNGDWTYCVEASSRPFPTSVHPLAVAAGATPGLELFTGGPAALGPVPVAIPADAPPGPLRVAPVAGGTALADVGVLVTPLPIVVEGPRTADAPLAVTVPVAVAGQIDAEGQADRHAFSARAGETLAFEIVARRAGSFLDARLRVLRADGAMVADADDATFERVISADPLLENWSAPADGEYVVEVRDVHGRGGPGYPYVLTVTRFEPGFTLEADTDKTLLAPGLAAPIYVRAVRRGGFAGAIDLAVEGLPAGVEVVAGRIAAGSVDGCLWLRAGPDAAPGFGNVTILGKAVRAGEGAPEPAAVRAAILQEVYLPGGGRGHYPVSFHTVALGAALDVRAVTVSTAEVRLVPGGSCRIDVTVERAPDYAGNITLDCMLQHLETPYGNPLPKGVTVDGASSKTLLSAGETTGHVTLRAAPDAPAIEGQLVPVTVHVPINFVMKHTFSGPPVRVSVAPP